MTGRAIAHVTYVAAHVYDYLITIMGLKGGSRTEGNPLCKLFIWLLGPNIGLALGKLIWVSLLIISLHYVAKKFAKQNMYPNVVKNILTFGTIVTTFGGSLWLFYL